MWLYIIIAIVVILLLLVFSTYNNLVKLKTIKFKLTKTKLKNKTNSNKQFTILCTGVLVVGCKKECLHQSKVFIKMFFLFCRELSFLFSLKLSCIKSPYATNSPLSSLSIA